MGGGGAGGPGLPLGTRSQAGKGRRGAPAGASAAPQPQQRLAGARRWLGQAWRWGPMGKGQHVGQHAAARLRRLGGSLRERRGDVHGFLPRWLDLEAPVRISAWDDLVSWSTHKAIMLGGTAVLLFFLPIATVVVSGSILLSLFVEQGSRKYMRVSRENKEELLEQISLDYEVKNMWFTVAEPLRARDLEVHVAKIGCRNPHACRGSLLFIHGAASTSVMFYELMGRMAEGYDCYAVDLPGFGLSGSVRELLEREGGEMMDWYADVMRDLVAQLAIADVHCVGHSLGSVVAMTTALRHPQVFARLTLGCPAGVFPTFTEYALFFAISFQLGLPQSVFQCFPRSVARMMSFWHTYGGRNLMGLFRVQRWSDQEAIAPWMVKQLSHWSGEEGRWDWLTIQMLFRLKCPFQLCYGHADSLIPLHQAEAVMRLAQNKMECSVLKDIGHSMFKAVDKMEAVIERTEQLEPAYEDFFEDVAERAPKLLADPKYCSSFALNVGRKKINMTYADLMAEFDHAETAVFNILEDDGKGYVAGFSGF